MKFLRMFAIAVLIGLLFFWTTPVLPDTLRPLEGVGNTEHRVVTLTMGLKEVLQKDPSWKMCGNYFARKENGEDKVILFLFEKGPAGGLPEVALSAFTAVDGMSVSINKGVRFPTVFVLDSGWDRKFFIKMNLEDYKTGLPCFGKGTKI